MTAWTSGSNEGTFCDVERTYTWCSSGSIISEVDVNKTDNWLDIPGKQSASTRCLSMSLNATTRALTHKSCEEKMPFLCEVNLIRTLKFDNFVI